MSQEEQLSRAQILERIRELKFLPLTDARKKEIQQLQQKLD